MRDYDVFMCYRGEKAALLAGRIYADMIELRNDGVKIFYSLPVFLFVCRIHPHDGMYALVPAVH